MDEIEIEVRVNKCVRVNIDIYDLIDGVNNLPMTKRWNHIAQIIGGVEVNSDELSDSQKNVIKNYLLKQLSMFDNSAPRNS